MEHTRPADIERRSMQIIGEELAQQGIVLGPQVEAVVKRVIHTTADFEMEDILYTDEGAVSSLYEKFAAGQTDTIIKAFEAAFPLNFLNLKNLYFYPQN